MTGKRKETHIPRDQIKCLLNILKLPKMIETQGKLINAVEIKTMRRAASLALGQLQGRFT